MTLDLQPGAAFGKYVLERRLGSGGFGDVWLTRDATGAHVALKVLHGQYQSSEAARLRAEIELLAAAASSRSSHIVRVLGGGSEPAPFVVMEYIEGTDLGREISRRGALPVPEVLRIAEDIADALATLQQAGIIHRDIKPANVMIDNQGVIKLTDFGIAKIVGVDSITTTNNIAMSVAYAAPEVFEGKVSYLSDRYAFGALLYHLLTGRPLFAGNYIEIMRHHVVTPPDLHALPAGTPQSLNKLIGDCLRKDPNQRPADSAAIQQAIGAATDELLTLPDPTVVQTGVWEPSKLGPWIIVRRSTEDEWTFFCRHESSGETASVEVHFADDLNYGQSLRMSYPGMTSRLILRPGEGWRRAPNAQFAFWLARPDEQTVKAYISPEAGSSVPPLNPQIDDIARQGGSEPSGASSSRRSSRPPMVLAAVGAITAAAVIVGLALALNGGSKGQSKGYPPQIRENFMKSCSATSGGSDSANKICSCSFDEIQKTYTVKEFVALEDEISRGGSRDELVAIVTKCSQQN